MTSEPDPADLGDHTRSDQSSQSDGQSDGQSEGHRRNEIDPAMPVTQPASKTSAESATGSGPDHSALPPSARPASRGSLSARVRIALADIKIAHSVFALPFAVLAAFLAGPGRALGEPIALQSGTESAPGAAADADLGIDPGGGFSWWSFGIKLGLIVLCMVFARTWAMLVNRIADRKLDAENPRTKQRAFAAGKLSTADGLLMLVGSAGLFIAACAMFVFFDNQWPLYGSLPVLAWIAFYSFTKRFTLLCHFFLGSALAVSPVAAAVAVDPGSLAMPSIWLLAGMVLCWVAGFDVIYALQDHAHDSEAGLHSIPATLGPTRAIHLSRVLHLLCLGALLGAWAFNPNLGSVFGVGVAATAVLLVAEHLVLLRRGDAGLNMAFFTLNGVISLVLGATGVADLFV